MSADRVREAASRLSTMCDRAPAAPWTVRTGVHASVITHGDDHAVVAQVNHHKPESVDQGRSTALYLVIAANPTLVAALAEWLIDVTVWWDDDPTDPAMQHALAVADAVLSVPVEDLD